MKILITDDCHDLLVQSLQKLGHIVNYKPQISLEEIDKEIMNFDGIIINTRVRMDQDRIAKAMKLKFIGRMGSGLDTIDLNYAAERNILVISTPQGNRVAVAEHALAMLLSMFNKLPLCAEQLKLNHWDREVARGRELSGLNIGIIGYGHTGSSFAKIISGFELNIFVYDKYKEVNSSNIGLSKLISCSLQEMLNNCEVLSFHLPLSLETSQLVNGQFINSCKDGVILINTSRGNIFNLKAVIEGLVQKKIGGCCLDVFPNEKWKHFSDEEKWQMSFLSSQQNVNLSPHVAGWTLESKIKIAEIMVKKIKLFDQST